MHAMSGMKTKGKTANWMYDCERRPSIRKPGIFIHIEDYHLLKDAFNKRFCHLPRERRHSRDEVSLT